jgi:hypothetical protein
MGDEPYTKRQKTSPNTSAPSTNQRQAYASERAQVLFACYRRGDANDPDRYVAAIAAVLAVHDFDLIRDVTDPRTGIMTDEKYMSFMPNAGELKVYCDGVAARKERLKKLGGFKVDFDRMVLEPPPPEPGDKATIFVPVSNPRYPTLVAWAKTAGDRLWKFAKSSDGRDGIWVAFHIWEQRATVAQRGQTFPEPKSLMLSEVTRKVMRDVDAERNGDVPTHPTEEAAE